MLVNESCVTEAVWSELFNRVHRFPTASKHQPLHVPPLGSSQRHNAGFGEHVQRHWVDSLQIIKFDAPVFKLIYIYPFKAYGTIKDNKFTPNLPNLNFLYFIRKTFVKVKGKISNQINNLPFGLSEQSLFRHHRLLHKPTRF